MWYPYHSYRSYLSLLLTTAFFPTHHTQLLTHPNDTLPASPPWTDYAWIYNTSNPLGTNNTLCHDNTTPTWLFYINPIGCTLCNKIPIPSTDPAVVKYTDQSYFNTSYYTWFGSGAVFGVYNADLHKAGLGDIADQRVVWPSEAPPWVQDKWEMTPRDSDRGFPCACYEVLFSSVIDDPAGEPTGPGGKRCMGLGDDYRQPWQWVTNVDCRRMDGVGGRVVQELHCDTGISFNALMPQVLGGGEGIFDPQPTGTAPGSGVSTTVPSSDSGGGAVPTTTQDSLTPQTSLAPTTTSSPEDMSKGIESIGHGFAPLMTPTLATVESTWYHAQLTYDITHNVTIDLIQ
ncbi:hypothetical protein HDV00_007933 [Rhizophlyctis rosea]|nr:hypothetical protein HDV00_007933 [Rhizophlyctis rosea]